MKNTLTYLQAYNAMTKFIDAYYRKTLPEGIGIMLSDMEFLHDKTTGDPATWNDWLKSLKKIDHNENMLSLEQSFDAMINFLKYYQDFAYSLEDIEKLLEYILKMKNNSQDESWLDWKKYLHQVLTEEDSRVYIKFISK